MMTTLFSGVLIACTEYPAFALSSASTRQMSWCLIPLRHRFTSSFSMASHLSVSSVLSIFTHTANLFNNVESSQASTCVVINSEVLHLSFLSE